LKKEFEAGEHPDEKLLFLDECDLHLHPILGNNWQFAGTQNRVPAAGQNRKSYCFGAIDFCGAEVTYRIADRKRSAEFVEFLEALRLRYMRKLHLVLDNYSIHFSKEVKRYLELHPGVFEFHFLPTYSPWLNPVETVWREMKAAVCRNYFHGTMANLKRAVHRYFASHVIHEGALRAVA
jgi:putative transposase